MKKYLTITIIIIATIIFSSFKNNIIRLVDDTTAFIKIGKILFPKHSDDIEKCITLFSKNEAEFVEKYENLVNEYDVIVGESSMTELLFSYGDSKNKVIYIDWRGEENEGEIEEYIQNTLSFQIDFTETTKFRKQSIELEKRDGEFVLNLFNEINTDLFKSGLILAFFNIEWDAYGFMVIPIKKFEEIESVKKNVITN